MPDYALLLSDRLDAAFFARANEIAAEEIAGEPGVTELRADQYGGMQLVRVRCDESQLAGLARLSCVQGLFAVEENLLRPLSVSSGFNLHPDFVHGEKYRGKTNETLTQLMINIGLQQVPDAKAVLDPMCGRGTTLLWAMRFGLNSVGVEQDGAVLGEVRRGLKKWTKLHRQKHKLQDGWIQKTNKKGIGRYLDFAAEGTSLRLVTGDSVNCRELVQRKRFDLIVTDLPYGVQHMGGKGTRNPIQTVADCAPGWADCLAPGGAMVIAFNAYQPKRAELEAVFETAGLEPVATRFEHRMSESILRDILVLKARS